MGIQDPLEDIPFEDIIKFEEEPPHDTYSQYSESDAPVDELDTAESTDAEEELIFESSSGNFVILSHEQPTPG